MDWPSVSWKFYDNITIDKEKSELSGLINIGSYGLHVLHGAFKTGVEAAGWEIKKLLMILLPGCQITSKLQSVLHI